MGSLHALQLNEANSAGIVELFISSTQATTKFVYWNDSEQSDLEEQLSHHEFEAGRTSVSFMSTCT
jgi:hypothetical protein